MFLSLKCKGRGNKFTPLPQNKFNKIVNKALLDKINFGFDSCSAPLFLKAVEDHKDFKKYEMMSQACESTLESAYINYKGEYFPCSFCEDEGEWKEGIDVISSEDFIENVWKHPKTNSFRDNLLKNINCMGCRECPMFQIGRS